MYTFLNSGTDCLGEASLGSAHDKAIVIKKMWYQYKDRHVDKWKRLESLEILLPTDGWLIFLLECQGNSMGGKKPVFSKCSTGINEHLCFLFVCLFKGARGEKELKLVIKLIGKKYLRNSLWP